MTLAYCRAPAAPVPIYTATDLYDRLSVLRLNLWKYSVISVAGGAVAVDPMTGLGEQKRGWAIPGGTSAARIELLHGVPGLAARDGAAYAMSFLADIDSGTGTLRAGWRDALGNPITGIADQSWTITTTGQTFTWEDYFSDDPDFALAAPDNPTFFIGVTGAGDIPVGRQVRITELQNQTDNYWDRQGITLPWRPARRDDRLLSYGEYILGLNTAEMALKPGQKMVVGPEGAGFALTPNGPVKLYTEPGTTRTLGAGDDGAYIRTTNVAGCVITVPADADVPIDTKTCVAIWCDTDGLVEIAEGAGVTVNLPFGGSLDLAGRGALVQLIKVAPNTWDLSGQLSGWELLVLAIIADALVAGDNMTITNNGDGTFTFDAATVPLVTLTASEALAAGDLVSFWNSSGAKVRKANATDDTKQPDGFVRAAVLSGDPATIYLPGAVNTAVSGLTPGAIYFLATTGGGVTATPPTTPGQWLQEVGKAADATHLVFSPKSGILL